MSKHVFSVMFLATTLATGCAGDDETGGDLEFRTTFGCTQCGIGGSNSAHANLYPIDQIKNGETNADGVRLLGVRNPGGVMYELRTEGDELIAWDPGLNTIVAMGTGLIGWDIAFYASRSAEFIDVRVFGYDNTIPSEATGAAPISGYALAYQRPGQPDQWYSVCPDSMYDPDKIAVTVIGNELYDEELLEVVPAPGWATIACFGNAVAKTKLVNYTPAQDFDGKGNPATVPQRQATLKMFTADYCGTGTSFTSDGTPLYWQNASKTVQTGLHPFSDIEALWTADGAICLGTPRLAEPEEVKAHCELPQCTQQMLSLYDHEWVTWINPNP